MIDPSIIFESVDQAADLVDLTKRLDERGIECQFTQSHGSAEPTGWSLRQTGPAGTWIKGSSIDRDLSLKKVQERIARRRIERQAAANRELLGDLLDDLNKKIEQDEDQRLILQQRSLLAALLQIPAELMRRLIAAMMNSIARLLERLFGLRDGALGRIEVGDRGRPEAVAPTAAPDYSTAAQIAKLAAAQKIMAEALAKTVEAIRQGDPTLLPGARVQDPEIQAARMAIIRKVEELDAGEDQDDEDQDDERERPR